MMTDLLNAFATLFVTIDPIGLAPLFLALTAGMSSAMRKMVARRSVLTAAGILVGFALLGGQLLNALGITIGAFQVAGGLLLFWTAFEMVFEKRQERKAQTVEARKSEQSSEDHNTPEDDDSDAKDAAAHLAVFPLAIPLMAGPGSISATILLATDASTLMLISLIGIVLTLLALCYAVFMLAGRIDRYLGATGRNVLSRLLGVILAALAVQFVVDGVLRLVS